MPCEKPGPRRASIGSTPVRPKSGRAPLPTERSLLRNCALDWDESLAGPCKIPRSLERIYRHRRIVGARTLGRTVRAPVLARRPFHIIQDDRALGAKAEFRPSQADDLPGGGARDFRRGHAYSLAPVGPHGAYAAKQPQWQPDDATTAHHPWERQRWKMAPLRPICHRQMFVRSWANGAPEGIRTPDPCLRRAVLYPAELPVLGIAFSKRPCTRLAVIVRRSLSV
jgi:hypothetical protein